MKREDIIITQVHHKGPYYRLVDPPHYIFHIEGVDGDMILTWTYNAWRGIVRDKVNIDRIEPYEG